MHVRYLALVACLTAACAAEHRAATTVTGARSHAGDERPLAFSSSLDGVQLHGTLATPARPPRAVVLLIGGAGKTDRDETVAPTRTASGRTEKLFKRLSDALVAGGFATLRYDTRGVLGEGGAVDVKTWTTADRSHLISDAADAARALLRETGLVQDRLFVLGHSEGTVTGVEAALALGGKVGGLLLLGAHARNIEQTLPYTMAASDPDRSPAEASAAAAAVLQRARSSSEPFAPDGKPLAWYREQLSAPANKDRLPLVKAPVALFQGEADPGTPPGEMDLLLAGRPDLDVHRYPGLGRGFSPARGGRPTGGPIDATVLADVVAVARRMATSGADGASRAPAVASPRPPSADLPPPLGAVRLARVQAAYAQVEPAVREWNLSRFGQSCLLLFDETQEWLLGCSLKDFKNTAESFGGQPIQWMAPSLRVTDRSMPFDSIKLGLVGTVFSYTRDGSGEELPVLVVQEWDTLHRQHPGFTQANIEDWLGVFVHEGFHAHQLWHPRVRALLARMHGVAQPEELAAFYAANEPFRAAVKREWVCLKEAADDRHLDRVRARAALASWLGLYEARGRAFTPAMEAAMPGKDPWRMDGFLTFLEGTARYVEARFLLAPKGDVEGLLANEASYGHFAASRGKAPSELAGLGNIGNKYFYSIGMYLSFLLDVADPSWKSHVFDGDGLLIDQVRRSAARADLGAGR